MKVELTGRHVEITDPIRKHVESQMAKLNSFFQKQEDAFAHVILTIEKHRQIAEIVVNWREHNLTVKETDKDLYFAISKAAEKLEKQVRRTKDKTIKRKQTAESVAVIAPEPDGFALAAAPLPPRIIPARQSNVKPMTADEAILNLRNENNQFVVFRDAETELASVLYKRKDGNYGLIQF